jgi:hypothetical protein
MGLQDMLAVLFGVKTAEAIDEYNEQKAIQKDLQRRVAYMNSPEYEREAQRKAKEQFEADHLAAARRITLLVNRIEPQDRLRPDVRALESDGGVKAGSEIPIEDFRDELSFGLYEVAVSGASFDRYAKAQKVPADADPADYEQYRLWLQELRAKYGGLIDDIFEACDTEILDGADFFRVRQKYGLEPAGANYFQIQSDKRLAATRIAR